MLDYLVNWAMANQSLVTALLAIVPTALAIIISNGLTIRSQENAAKFQNDANQIRQEELKVQQETNRIHNEEIKAMKTRSEAEHRLKQRQQYLSHILPKQHKFMDNLDAIADLPIRNSPDYLNLRLEPVGSIKFDTHQPLVRENTNPPKDNALYITLHNKFYMMRGEFSCLFPDLVPMYDTFLSAEHTLYNETWKLHSTDSKTRQSSNLPTAWEDASKRYEELKNAMVASMAKAINDR